MEQDKKSKSLGKSSPQTRTTRRIKSVDELPRRDGRLLRAESARNVKQSSRSRRDGRLLRAESARNVKQSSRLSLDDVVGKHENPKKRGCAITVCGPITIRDKAPTRPNRTVPALAPPPGKSSDKGIDEKEPQVEALEKGLSLRDLLQRSSSEDLRTLAGVATESHRTQKRTRKPRNKTRANENAVHKQEAGSSESEDDSSRSEHCCPNKLYSKEDISRNESTQSPTHQGKSGVEHEGSCRSVGPDCLRRSASRRETKSRSQKTERPSRKVRAPPRSKSDNSNRQSKLEPPGSLRTAAENHAQCEESNAKELEYRGSKKQSDRYSRRSKSDLSNGDPKQSSKRGHQNQQESSRSDCPSRAGRNARRPKRAEPESPMESGLEGEESNRTIGLRHQPNASTSLSEIGQGRMERKTRHHNMKTDKKRSPKQQKRRSLSSNDIDNDAVQATEETDKGLTESTNVQEKINITLVRRPRATTGRTNRRTAPRRHHSDGPPKSHRQDRRKITKGDSLPKKPMRRPMKPENVTQHEAQEFTGSSPHATLEHVPAQFAPYDNQNDEMQDSKNSEDENRKQGKGLGIFLDAMNTGSKSIMGMFSRPRCDEVSRQKAHNPPCA